MISNSAVDSACQYRMSKVRMRVRVCVPERERELERECVCVSDTHAFACTISPPNEAKPQCLIRTIFPVTQFRPFHIIRIIRLLRYDLLNYNNVIIDPIFRFLGDIIEIW